MDQRVRTGGCACGAVRYEVRGEPLVVGLCHCADCRKESGAAFLYYADWPIEEFSSDGEYQTWEGRSFCGICGSRLFHVNPEKGHAEICLGSLVEAPAGLAPRQEGWIKRREEWMAPVAGAAQHREDP
jgi:hypothetical protein